MATTHAALAMGRRSVSRGRLRPLGGAHQFNGVSDESVRLDVRTTLLVTAPRLLDGISTSFPVIRGPQVAISGRFTPLNREPGPSNG